MPGIGNPVAWDRYAYVMNNPLRFIDPKGHFCVDYGNHRYCSDDTDNDHYYWPLTSFPPLPNGRDVKTRESEKTVNPKMKELTVGSYEFIRNDLFFNYGWECVDTNGKIRDEILMALILAGELSIFDLEEYIYKEAVEALGNQYFDEDFEGSSHCGSDGCTISQQVSWLFTMEFIRGGHNNLIILTNEYHKHMSGAKQAKAGYFIGLDESWFWGNTTVDKINAPENIGLIVAKERTDSYPGKPWFIVHKVGYQR